MFPALRAGDPALRAGFPALRAGNPGFPALRAGFPALRAGAIEGTKPDKFIGFGAMEGTKTL